MNSRSDVGWAIVTIGVACYPAETSATTRRVPSEYSTINNALDVSVSGDTVLVAPGTYSDFETRPLGSVPNSAIVFMRDGVTLKSEGGSGATTLDLLGQGTGEVDVIYIDELMSGTTAIEGFTVTGVPQGTGLVVVFDGGLMTFRDCVFRNAYAAESTSGGITCADNDLSLYNCTFTNCDGFLAGGVFVNDARLYLEGCTFVDNPGRPIGMTGEPGANTFRFEMNNCTFIRNGNPVTGTGQVNIFQQWDGAIARNCYFEENYATGGGGGLSIGQSRNVLVENCVFWRNATTNPGSAGGGLGVGGLEGGTIRNCTFSENHAGSLQVIGGAAITVNGGHFIIENNVIANSGIGGPAVRVSGGATATSSCNVFWNNAEGNAFGFVLSATDRIVDPLFCDAPHGNFTVGAASPCLPPNSLGCGLIGAFGRGCDPVSMKSKSWGSIKGAYK